MVNRINLYIFNQVVKSCILVFFIFISITWLLQLTRLFTLTNFIQIDILNVIYLSFFLIPNLLTVILPFILIFGILLCFIKLHKDREIVAIYTLGLQLKPFKYSLLVFSILISFLYILINFYISPIIYEKYKIKEFELRNTINFDTMMISNFLKLNDSTTIDFEKKDNSFKEILINFSDEKNNLIFAKNGFIKKENNNYIFQLNKGFKISILNNEIEKLEFDNYVLNINEQNNVEFSNYDRNTFTIFDDLKNKNYINISFKVFDIIICVLIIYFFYINNLVSINFNTKNNLFFIIISIVVLLINQLLKNAEVGLNIYFVTTTLILLSTVILIKLKNKNV